MALTAIRSDWDELTGQALSRRSFQSTIETIGDQLLGDHLLAFEVASVLLLFALLGAIVLVTVSPGGDDGEDRSADGAGGDP